jgi:hypothetical protein
MAGYNNRRDLVCQTLAGGLGPVGILDFEQIEKVTIATLASAAATFRNDLPDQTYPTPAKAPACKIVGRGNL